MHPETEEPACILDAVRLGTIVPLSTPPLQRSLLGGWLIVFIVAARELSAPIFLVGPEYRHNGSITP